MNEFPKTNQAFRHQVWAEWVREIAESSIVKSSAAVCVGGLAFVGVYYDSRPFRVAATGLGLALPAIHLLVVLITPWLIGRVIRRVNEEGTPPPERLRGKRHGKR